MAVSISTCLWFDNQGLAAAEFYTQLIPNSQITNRDNIQSETPLIVEFTLDGVPYQALNGGSHFQINEAASIVLTTETQAETDHFWNALIAEGGAESMCGWLKDKFGVSWQIVPRPITDLLNDSTKNEAAMAAVLKMKRLIIADVEAACEDSNS